MADKKDTSKTRLRKGPAGGKDCNDPRALLNTETFTNALESLKRDICDKLDSKIDTFAQTLRSEVTAVKDEPKASLTSLQTTVNTQGAAIKDSPPLHAVMIWFPLKRQSPLSKVRSTCSKPNVRTWKEDLDAITSA